MLECERILPQPLVPTKPKRVRLVFLSLSPSCDVIFNFLFHLLQRKPHEPIKMVLRPLSSM